ncbi:uncharacterized protein BXZ73DRAFT_98333 [Epithele typhae]|uniref:uncharacterized protein n=1 Tax=Epithele typhae TaxID=378194 RepID=UPI00200772D6|nr:uncharacterized protein BXZ73DRAFT_98333 [Epithele typhae]KAH9941121.1 hypothetical protein BXZ73DRAFT_98333 [Epithele typhae]
MWQLRRRSDAPTNRDEKLGLTTSSLLSSSTPRRLSWFRRTYRLAPCTLVTRVVLVVLVVAVVRLSSSRTGSPTPRTRWVQRGPPASSAPLGATGMRTEEDVYAMLGIEGCASSREVFWHLGADPADSVTEGHFFSISCMLYPHVRATPDYTKSKTFDRAWPQNLYLNPSSPLFSSLKLPKDFDVTTTPLVTFRRVDLLMRRAQLDELYWQLHPTSKYLHNRTTLFSDEPHWNLSPAEYVDILTTPRPAGGYSTLIVSSAGHWTTHNFEALRDYALFNEGIFNVVDFFREAMRSWADEVQAALDRIASPRSEEGTDAQRRLAPGGRPVSVRTKPRSAQQVLVRAYVPGHDGCHNKNEPVRRYKKDMAVSYNWPQIVDFNRAFSDVLSSGDYPDIHYLAIDNPALLRPETHVSTDCLHLMTGSGVVEGWTQYIWHYLTVEIPELVRSGH